MFVVFCKMLTIHRIFKTFKDDYKKENGHLLKAKYTTWKRVQSYITKNNGYIIVYTDVPGYNVYDIENDEWLLDKCISVGKYDTFSDSVKSIMINDELMILSEAHVLNFYYIPTQDLKSFILVKTYKLETLTENEFISLDYCYHGMCCIGFKHTIIHNKMTLNKKRKAKSNQYNVKILLLGGSKNKKFFQSLLIVDIEIILPVYESKPLIGDSFDATKTKKSLKNCINITKETLMDSKQLMDNYRCFDSVTEKENCENNRIPEINIKEKADDNKQDHTQQKKEQKEQGSITVRDGIFYNFGCRCLRDTWDAVGGSGEPIVLLFGGGGSGTLVKGDIYGSDLRNKDQNKDKDKHNNEKSCFILNVDKCQLTKIKNFLPFGCGANPTVYEVNDGLIVAQGASCAYFKVFNQILKWNIARLIWIGFYKNEKNNKCLIDKLPKDIIVHYIFKFLGHYHQTIQKNESKIVYINTTSANH